MPPVTPTTTNIVPVFQVDALGGEGSDARGVTASGL